MVENNSAKNEADIQRKVANKLAELERATLRVIAYAVLFIYSARVLAAFIMLDLNDALIIVVPVSVSLLVAGGILVADYEGRLARRRVMPLTILLGALITFNLFYILFASGATQQLYFAALLLFGVGLAVRDFRLWLSVTAPFLAVYSTSLYLANVDNPAPYIAVLVVSLVLSAAAYFVRMPTLRKLTELQVRHEVAARKLEVSNKAKDQFLANMTHELRTPMTGVIGMIDLLADTKLDEQQQYYLGTARKSARYLLSVINDILDVSKLEAGKLEIKPAPMDALALTRDIAALFDMRATQKGLALNLFLPQSTPLPVIADRIRISQILLNLLENALKFTDKGRISIGLSAKPAGDYWELGWSVSDTGIGIPADRLPILFDRFEQVDTSTTRKAHGTGLGLAIIRDLVHLMKGSITTESEPGKGSTFTVSFMLPTADAADIPEEDEVSLSARFQPAKDMEFPEAKPEAVNGHAAAEGPVAGLNVLYAEDNPVNRQLIARIIEREGWQGIGVTNGQEALDAAQAPGAVFDLILMDIQMPVMDGLTAIKQLKQDGDAPPVIALTANTMPEDIRNYEAAGADAIVGKPINVMELRDVVADLTVSDD